MRRFSFRTATYLVIDLFLLVLCFVHISSIVNRATVPFEVELENGDVIVSSLSHAEAAGVVQPGDRVLRWRQEPIPFSQALEFLADASGVDQQIDLTIQRGQEILHANIRLIPYYPSIRFVLITIFVGVVIWMFGVFVLWNRQGELTATSIHWTMILFATSIMMTWGTITPGSFSSYFERGIWFIAYIGAVATFFFFTSMYPKAKPGSIIFKGIGAFAPALLLTVGMLYYQFRAIQLLSVENFEVFQRLFDLFHTSLFLYFGGAVFNILHSYRTAATSEERKKLQWILWGLSIGSLPYLLLHILPQILFSAYLVAEEYPTIALLVIPFSFTVSLIKYKFLDVEIVISRSILYALLSLLAAGSYFLIVLLAATLIGKEAKFEEYLTIASLMVLVGLLLNPLRKRVQRFIDETLFPARTNFRKIVVEIGDRMQRVFHADALFSILLEAAQGTGSFEAVGVYRYEPGRLVMQASGGKPMNRTLALKKEHITLFSQARVFAVQEAVKVEHPDIDVSREALLRRLGCAVCIPLLTVSKELLGVFAARPSAASGKLGEEEVDLLRTVCVQASEHLERLQLQQNIIFEREERRKMEQLSNLKSDFVSYVSHELQTPLTSVRMFSDLLKKELRDGKSRRYVRVIEGETERLSRMVATILDSARIDQGIKQYSFQRVDIREVTRKTLDSMKYQITKYGFRFEFRTPREKLMLSLDSDAYAQALINLISNALKYAAKGKYLKVSVAKNGEWIECRVEDRGNGIPEKALPHLFEKFYRDPSYSSGVQGVGLGLPLVKHIMEAHGGTVEVRSKVGKGSTFTLRFPMNDHPLDNTKNLSS